MTRMEITYCYSTDVISRLFSRPSLTAPKYKSSRPHLLMLNRLKTALTLLAISAVYYAAATDLTNVGYDPYTGVDKYGICVVCDLCICL